MGEWVMTMTPRLVSDNSNQLAIAEQQSFMAFALERMFPKMIGYWPASAGQFERNAQVLAEAFEEKLEGFTPREIIDGLSLMSDDAKRGFAPNAGELKSFLIGIKPSKPAVHRLIASMSSIEMQVCVMCLSGVIPKTQQAVDAAVNKLVNSAIEKGGLIDGKRGFAPLKSIING